MMFKKLTILIFLPCLLTIVWFTYKVNGNSKNLSVQSTSSREDAIEVESTLSRSKQSIWQVSTMNLPDSGDLESIYFIDDKNGWVNSNKHLYRTLDGGGKWEELTVKRPDDSDISLVHFVNQSSGWIVLQKRAENILDYELNHFWLYHTSDGGATWSALYESNESVIFRMSFTGDRYGWMIGTKYTGIRPLKYEILTLYTTDKGKTWNDVSEKINSLAQSVINYQNIAAVNIVSEDEETATTVMGRGELFKTHDAGQSWSYVGNIGNEWPQTGIKRLTKRDSGYNLIGGTVSFEGVWGVVIERQENLLKKYRLRGAYFSDGLFISQQELLASGSSHTDYEKRKKHFVPRNGTIFYSNDNGKSWDIAYQTSKVNTLNKLFAVDANHVWAVGDNGLIIYLKRKNI